jgi:RNA polymerase sigma-70 factor (ECF subfamily)
LAEPKGGTTRTTELVDRARRGDETAFRRLVERYRDRIYRQALVQTGDADDAEDVTQEVLVRLHLGLAGFRSESKFETWLFTLTRNAAADFRSKQDRPRRLAARMRELGGGEDAVASDPAGRLEASLIGDRVRAFLAKLSERQRTVLDLVDLQGYPTGEVAELLGMRPVTVRTHLMRARRALREELLRREHTEGEPQRGL